VNHHGATITTITGNHRDGSWWLLSPDDGNHHTNNYHRIPYRGAVIVVVDDCQRANHHRGSTTAAIPLVTVEHTACRLLDHVETVTHECVGMVDTDGTRHALRDRARSSSGHGHRCEGKCHRFLLASSGGAGTDRVADLPRAGTREPGPDPAANAVANALAAPLATGKGYYPFSSATGAAAALRASESHLASPVQSSLRLARVRELCKVTHR
jgi:hypothetical protein